MNNKVFIDFHTRVDQAVVGKIKLAQGVEIDSVIEPAVFPMNVSSNKVDALIEVFVGGEGDDSLKFGGFHRASILADLF